MNAEDMISQLSGRLSLRRRVATVVALLGGLAMAFVVSLLWATEPGLPPGTQLAFGAIVVVGLAWVVYGVWVLSRRMPLFALDRVVAGWLALAASGLLAVPVAVVTVLRHRTAPVALAAVAVLVILAGVNLVRAQAHRAALLRRKRELGG
jgi:hypothetical protein